jgi:PAS domain S-box-containing protein
MQKKHIVVINNDSIHFEKIKTCLEESLNCEITKISNLDYESLIKAKPDLILADIKYAKDIYENHSLQIYLYTIPLVYICNDDYDMNRIRIANKSNPADYLMESDFYNNITETIDIIGNILNDRYNYNQQNYFKNKFYSFINSIDEMVMILDKELNIQNINKYGLELMNTNLDEVMGKKCYDLFNPDGNIDNCPAKESIRTGKVCSLKTSCSLLEKTFSVKSIPIKDNDDNVIKIVEMFRDVTDFERVKEKDEEIQSLYSNLFNNNHIPMLLIEPETGLIYEANPSAIYFYGYTQEEIQRKYIWQINQLSKDKVFNKMKNASQLDEQHFLFQHKIADGSIRDVEVYSGPIYIKGKTLLYSIIVDITDRIELQRKLNQKNQRLNMALEASSNGLWEWKTDTKELYLSPSFYTLLGFDPYEIKPTVDLWTKLIHPKDRNKCLLNKIKDQVNPDGVIKSKFRIKKKTGEYIWVISKAKIVENDLDGNPLRIIGSYEDITKLVEKEESLLKTIKEKEALVREVHHRVKNNLQIIISLLKLQTNTIKDNKYRELIKASENRIRTMALVHENLYQTQDFSQINFNSYLNRLISNLQYSLGVNRKKVKINMDIVEDIYLNINEAIPLAQIVNELFTNALKYGCDNDSPQIDVTLYQDDFYKYTLVVSNNNGNFPKNIDIENPETMGLQLVKGLTDQLNGKLVLDKSNNQTTFKVIF